MVHQIIKSSFIRSSILSLLALVSVAAQSTPSPQMSEAVFKNVQVLKGIPVDEFMDTMGMFAAALGLDCASCHDQGISKDRNAFAIATPQIQRARQMVLMMNAINRTNFGNQARVSCFTCHRGQIRPEVVPNLALQYGVLMDDPNAMAIFPSRSGSVDAVFTKYLQALGGAQRVAALTSVAGTGVYSGYNTSGNEHPIEIVATAPNRRATAIRTDEGTSVETFDGASAWAAEAWRPLPLLPLTGGNLAGARLNAIVMFPAGLQKAFSQWQVSSVNIDDKPVDLLQGSNPGELPVNFYFDESGLLTRLVRWSRTAVGIVPTQIDYSDYRDVGGVRLPFKSVITWTNGQNTIQMREVRTNVPVDAARFARPSPFPR